MTLRLYCTSLRLLYIGMHASGTRKWAKSQILHNVTQLRILTASKMVVNTGLQKGKLDGNDNTSNICNKNGNNTS